MKKTLFCLAALLFAAVVCRGADFEHGVATDKKPWTQKQFLGRPEQFHFAIFSDRTGGSRPGVFKNAANKLNLLRPEFAICVGDLIQGYSKSREQISQERQEVDRIVNSLAMPFFYLPGNHDISNQAMAEYWEKDYGCRYYWFVYKNVLFVCLDSQENVNPKAEKLNISQAQVKWLKKVLQDHQNVRWTFLFMHKPLWRNEERRLSSAGREVFASNVGFKPVADALAGRNYTIFAGHLHKYTKFVRNEQKYFILSVTGGGSSLRGPEYGEFDHIIWVTVTDDGPVVANLSVNGIYDEDVVDESKYEKLLYDTILKKKVKFVADKDNKDNNRIHFTATLTNPLKTALQYNIQWGNDGKEWKITPLQSDGAILPGKKQKIEFTAEKAVSGNKQPPECKIIFCSDDGEINSEIRLLASCLVNN